MESNPQIRIKRAEELDASLPCSEDQFNGIVQDFPMLEPHRAEFCRTLAFLGDVVKTDREFEWAFHFAFSSTTGLVSPDSPLTKGIASDNVALALRLKHVAKGRKDGNAPLEIRTAKGSASSQMFHRKRPKIQPDSAIFCEDWLRQLKIPISVSSRKGLSFIQDFIYLVEAAKTSEEHELSLHYVTNFHFDVAMEGGPLFDTKGSKVNRWVGTRIAYLSALHRPRDHFTELANCPRN